jgi:hypothetical protein
MCPSRTATGTALISLAPMPRGLAGRRVVCRSASAVDSLALGLTVKGTKYCKGENPD